MQFKGWHTSYQDGSRKQKFERFVAVLLLPSRSLTSCTDGSSFSLKQPLKLALQRAGNYSRVNYISLKDLAIISGSLER